jgi:hypothetical protein
MPLGWSRRCHRTPRGAQLSGEQPRLWHPLGFLLDRVTRTCVTRSLIEPDPQRDLALDPRSCLISRLFLTYVARSLRLCSGAPLWDTGELGCFVIGERACSHAQLRAHGGATGPRGGEDFRGRGAIGCHHFDSALYADFFHAAIEQYRHKFFHWLLESPE